MPRESRGTQIVEAIREYLKKAVYDSEPITDGRLMLAARCSRRTFYKYVTTGSQIQLEIDKAIKQQKKILLPVDGEPAKPDQVAINIELRKENEKLKDALRGLEGRITRLISNLSERGVPPADLQAALTDEMSKPDRRYPRGGRSRRHKKAAGGRSRKGWY